MIGTTIRVEWVTTGSMSLLLGLIRIWGVAMEVMDKFFSFRPRGNVKVMFWFLLWQVPWSMCMLRIACWLVIALCGSNEVKLWNSWFSWLVLISFRSLVAAFRSLVSSGWTSMLAEFDSLRDRCSGDESHREFGEHYQFIFDFKKCFKFLSLL